MNTSEFLAITISNNFAWDSFNSYVSTIELADNEKALYTNLYKLHEHILDMCNALIFGTEHVIKKGDFKLEKLSDVYVFSYKHIKMTINKSDFTQIKIDDKKGSVSVNGVNSAVVNKTVVNKTLEPSVRLACSKNNPIKKVVKKKNKKEKFIYRIREITTGKYISRRGKATWQQRGAVIEAAEKEQRYHGPLEICMFPVNDPTAMSLADFTRVYEQEQLEVKMSKAEKEKRAKRQEIEKEIRNKAIELSKLQDKLNSLK